MGGVSGLVYASVPTIAYVIVNAIAGLDAAVVVAVGASAGLIVLRLLRKEPLQPAVSRLSTWSRRTRATDSSTRTT